MADRDPPGLARLAVEAVMTLYVVGGDGSFRRVARRPRGAGSRAIATGTTLGLSVPVAVAVLVLLAGLFLGQ